MEELNIDAQKGYDSSISVEMWYRRACEYEVERESGDLNILRESMLRWWRRKLTRNFSQLLMWGFGTCKCVGSSQVMRGVEGDYIFIEG